MSIRRLPRAMGIWVVCNGPTDDGCPTKEKRFTANIVVGVNRTAAASEGWGRGKRKDRKRADICPTCLPVERALHAKEVAAREARKDERRAAKKALLSAEPRPKKPRKPRSASPSPSADSAPALAT